MAKGKLLGVQTQPAATLPVELISHNRIVQTIGMRTVYPQLMSTTCLRIECHMPVVELLVIGCRRLAMELINHLSRTVIEIRPKRQRQNTVFLLHLMAQPRHIALFHLVAQELVLQVVISRPCLCDHHQSTRRHVEPMDDQRSLGFRTMGFHQTIHTLSRALPWHGEHTRGLTYHTDVVILIDDRQHLMTVIIKRVRRHI